MADPAPASPSSEPSPGGSELSTLRDATRWLIASSGAIAAVALSGVGLAGLTRTGADSLWLAVVGCLLAFAGAGATLVSAVNVLAPAATSISSLVSREVKMSRRAAQRDGEETRIDVDDGCKRIRIWTPIVSGGAADDASDLNRIITRTLEKVVESERGSSEWTSLQDDLTEFRAAATRLVQWWNEAEAERRFAALKYVVPLAWIAVVIGAIVFTVASASAEKSVKVDKPTVASLYTNEADLESLLGLECRSSRSSSPREMLSRPTSQPTTSAVAATPDTAVHENLRINESWRRKSPTRVVLVGGTYEWPTFVLGPSEHCEGAVVRWDQGKFEGRLVIMPAVR